MLSEEQFVKGMAILIAAYPDYSCMPETVDVYREHLSHLTPQEWELAVNSHIQNYKWFPKISELIAASQAGRPLPEEIWGRLLVAAEDGGDPPEWVDEPIKKALLSVGGWDAFCITAYDELRFFFKPFKEVYQVARKQEQALRVEGAEPQRSIT
jgi:hypothetical protein